MTWVKICGITRTEDAAVAAEAGADALGLVFAESPRRVSLPQAREIAQALAAVAGLRVGLPGGVGTTAASEKPLVVGVFVDAPVDEVVETVWGAGLGAVQLHGEETGQYVEALRRKLGWTNGKGPVRVIKAVRVAPGHVRG
ncbi:MAG: hypothetical protein HYY08_00935, partial [Firmicutes bacterium]|nr:hypothetical protein [Bacillota bacterium]